MADYHTFTSARTTDPDPATLVVTLRGLDATAGLQVRPDLGPRTYVVKKASPWTAPQITAAQTAIDTAPEFDPAAADVDQKVLKAIVLGIWEVIPNPTLTKAQLRARIIAIWKGLP